MSTSAPIPMLTCSTADLETMEYGNYGPADSITFHSNPCLLNSYLEAYLHDTSLMHNALIRGFNSIVAQVLKIQPCEISAFATYVAAFCETLRRHCEGENLVIFPHFAAHVALDGSDNLIVLQKLKRVEEWVAEATETPEKTDPTELKAAMEVLAPAFASNMHDQIEQMHLPKLQPFTSGPELRALVNDDILWIGQNSHMEYLLPFLFLHHDYDTNAFWPGLPAEAKAAVPALIEMHVESWSYAPFSLAINLQ